MVSTIPVHEGPRPVWLDRTIAATVVAAAAVCVAAMVSVEPDPRGFDTHVQFGMQPCGWPKAYGLPCPTCGATTAAALVVHGRLLQAVVVQPFGAAIACAGLALAGTALWCLVRARSFLDVWRQLPHGRLLGIGIALLLVAWGYKCLRFPTG